MHQNYVGLSFSHFGKALKRMGRTERSGSLGIVCGPSSFCFLELLAVKAPISLVLSLVLT